MRALLWVLTLASLGRAQAAAAAFERDVLPILQRQCFECHQGRYTDAKGRVRNPKGGLRLDGQAWILHGGDDGPAVLAGRAADSPLWQRVSLPDDDDDRMPKDKDPLTEEQIATLRRWIDGGADFGGWTGAAGPEATAGGAAGGAAVTAPAARAALLAELGKDLTPLPEAALGRAAAGKARIEPLAAGSALLRVAFPGHEDQSGDAEIAALSPLREHIAELSLARTRVTDQALAQIARLPRLVKLDLRDTAVTDRGVAALRGMPELRSLNLVGTRAGDGAAGALATLRKLEALYLWRSAVTPAGEAQLRAKLPGTRIIDAPELPEPEPEAAGDGPRRRRR